MWKAVIIGNSSLSLYYSATYSRVTQTPIFPFPLWPLGRRASGSHTGRLGAAEDQLINEGCTNDSPPTRKYNSQW